MPRSHDEDPRAATAVDAKIGALIRARRLELGMSQTVLADAVGVTFQQIQKYEKGINRVAASTLIDVAAALDARVSDLLPLPGKKGEGADVAADEAREVLVSLARLSDEGRRLVALLARALASDARYKGAKRRSD